MNGLHARGIENERPLTLEEGGSEEPFDPARFEVAVTANSQSYRCAGSLFWINFAYAPCRSAVYAEGSKFGGCFFFCASLLDPWVGTCRCTKQPSMT